MRKIILAALALFLFALAAKATDRITASIAITNAAGTTNGQTFTVNGDVRTWTNNVVVSQSQVLTNSTAAGAKTNLYLQIGLNAFSQVVILDAGSTNFQLQAASGVALTVTPSAGWATVIYSTQQVSGAANVVVPFTSEPAAVQTNIVSGVVAMVGANQNTNAIAESAPAMVNFVGKASPQTITGQKIFNNFSNYFAGSIFGWDGSMWAWATGNVSTLYIAGGSMGGTTNYLQSTPAGLSIAGTGPLNLGMDVFVGAHSISGTHFGINSSGFFGDGSGLTNVPSSALVGSAWLLSGNNATTAQFLGTTNQAPMRFVAYSNTVAVFDTNNTIRLGRGHTIETNVAFDSIVAGGYSNVVSHNGSSAPTTAAIVGGNNNTNQGAGSFIGGGFNNFMSDSATTAFIAGGNGNTNASISGFVCGYGNTLFPNASFVGGHANLICPSSGTVGSFIGSGQGNYIGTNANGCVLVGGQFNNISNNAGYSFLGSGYQNTIGPNAADAVVPGGFQNKADAQFAFAAGQRAKAIHNGAFVWSDSQLADYSSSAADTFNVRAQGGFILNGPMKLPWFELTTLGNGINQDIIVGANVSVNLSGPTGAFSIEGIAGGTDGMVVELLNLTTFNMTIACEGGATGNDPVAANRIVTMTGADQTTTGNGFVRLKYKANLLTGRWVVTDFNP
jgi:hypothetical protein